MILFVAAAEPTVVANDDKERQRETCDGAIWKDGEDDVTASLLPMGLVANVHYSRCVTGSRFVTTTSTTA